MANTSVLYGVGGVVLGLLGGVALGNSTSESGIDAAIKRSLVPAQEAAEQAAAASAKTYQESLAGLETRLKALETGLAENMPDLSALKTDLSKEMSAKIDAVGETLSKEIAKNATTQGEAIKSAIAGVTDQMQESARVAAAAVAGAAPGGGGSSDMPKPEAGEEGSLTVSDPTSVGKTAIFADGAVRAFVSRIDPSGGSVRLVINGEQVNLGAGGTTKVSMEGGDCAIAVMALGDNGATLGSDCGSQDMTDAAAAPASDVAPENGIKPGNTVTLADGAVRVFVSRVDDAAGEARIAVNGVATQVVTSGDEVEVTSGDQDCTVTVTGIGQGLVGLDASCG